MFDLELKSNPTSRIQLVGMDGLLSPACCMVCGGTVRELGFIRLDVYMEFYGECYLCVDYCLKNLLDAMGGLTRDEAVSVYTTANDALVKVDELQAELDIANERLSHYDSILRGINPEFVVPPVPSTIFGPINKSETGVNTKDAPTGAGTRESESPKPVKVARLINPPRTPSSDGDSIEL